ncbi:MAG: hypothetical protein SFU98_09170 [Leptospiraceae bacterium]|nr:hypothetical protein [Leptospiraceae bacterium]
MANTEEELSQIINLLSPLNKNPIHSESLNVMAKNLRKILGEPEPEFPVDDDEDTTTTSSQEDDSSDLAQDSNKTPEYDFDSPPEVKNFEDDDDDDLDALLNTDIDTALSQKPNPKEDDLGLDDFDSEKTEDTVAEDDFSNLSNPVEDDEINLGEEDFTSKQEDPFGEEAKDSSEDPFGESSDDIFGDSSKTEEDPFADSEDFSASNTESSEVDPFADFDSSNTSTNEEDPFADFGSEESKATSGDEDPFSNFGSGQEDSDDPFGEVGGSKSEGGFGDDEESFGEGFASGDESSEVPDFGSDDFDDEVTSKPSKAVSSFDDNFDDLGSGTSSVSSFDDGGGLGDLDGDHFGDFEESRPSVEDDEESEMGSLHQLDDDDENVSDYDSGIEDDLAGLAQDAEEENELTDEELAIIQQELISYPPKLKRTIIDCITNDKLSPKDQRDLLELIKTQQKPADIAEYLSDKLGYEVQLFDDTGAYSQSGIPIIATKDIYTKQGEFERRQKLKRYSLLAAASIFLVGGLIFGYKYLYKPLRAAAFYNDGIEEIAKAGFEKDPKEKERKLMNAEDFFKAGERINPNDVEILNRYGMAYMRIGAYERSFEKLFGKLDPPLYPNRESVNGDTSKSWMSRTDVPYITIAKGQRWDESKLQTGDNSLPKDPRDILRLVSQDKIERKILKAGAYIVSELGKKVHDNRTYINLGKFHSNVAINFVEGEGKVYKNDNLAINYFKQVFTDGEDPRNIEATSGLAKVYYDQQNFGKAASYYNKIIEEHPKNPVGHGGLLSTFIEMWRKDRNPQFVLNHHRQVKNVLGIEKDLSLAVLAKLASFYIDLNPTELRIRYNVDPEDQVTNMDIDETTLDLLNIAFDKKEVREDGQEIDGSDYAEQYYQRGRYYISKNESLRGLKQFELAASNDPAHYLAVMEMAEYYQRIENNSEAWKLLENAFKRYDTFHLQYGNRPEDETLMKGDVGRIFFNMGKIVYLESALLNSKDKMDEFPARKVYPNRSLGELTELETERRNNLNNALAYFEKANKYKLKDETLKRELYYYTAWINYMNSDFEGALGEWANLGEEDTYSNVNIILGRANAFYYTNQLNASLGNYLKVKEDFEEKEAQIQVPVQEESTHQEIYQTLIAVYNNIGAIYEKKGNLPQALKHYWKAIEMARKINTVSEIANYNKDIAFKGSRKSNEEPLLEDWLSPTVDSIKDLTKSKRKNVYL